MLKKIFILKVTLIQVGVSVLKVLLHVTRPNTVVLGNIPGTQIYQNLSRYKETVRVPSFFILAIESPMYFANSMYLQERLAKLKFFARLSICLIHISNEVNDPFSQDIKMD